MFELSILLVVLKAICMIHCLWYASIASKLHILWVFACRFGGEASESGALPNGKALGKSAAGKGGAAKAGGTSGKPAKPAGEKVGPSHLKKAFPSD